MNLIYYLPHQLPIDVRFRILGNQEIKRKSLNCVVTQASLPGIIFWQQWSVFTQKQISDFSDCTTLLYFLTFCQILCHQLQFQCNIARDIPISMFLEETSNVNELNINLTVLDKHKYQFLMFLHPSLAELYLVHIEMDQVLDFPCQVLIIAAKGNLVFFFL